MNNEVIILAATRTPIGSLCGSLSSLKAHDLGSIVIKAAVSQAGIELNDVTEVVLGQVLTGGQGQNPARQASIKAGLPNTVPAYTVNMICGSGLKAIAMGYQAILLDPEAIVVAGGQESMSQAPHLVEIRKGVKMGNVALTDSILQDGLTDAFHNIHMGITAENVASQNKIGRIEQDEFAVESQRRTDEAIKKERFKKEITPVTITARTKTIVDTDEHPRSSTTLESLSKLKPAFIQQGTVTAGNASGINDGAAVVVLASSSSAAARKLKPLARIVGFAQSGIDPRVMGLGPVPAIQSLFKRIGWTKDDVDLFELNEAFAAQSLAIVRELGLDPEKVNVNGGAISLGHPIGASGARILVTLLHALEQRGGKRGVASLCIGGGMGIAMAIELC